MGRQLGLLGLACAAMAAGVGCDEVDSATSLNPAGPPWAWQVVMSEDYTDTSNIVRPRTVFGWGVHPTLQLTEPPAVTTGIARRSQSIRVVMDELLVGNYLEEIACRARVDDDAFARVPVGATPDDIARCAVADDILPATCPADNSHSVCIGPDGPVGVLDADQNGAADKLQFIDGAVTVRCGDIIAPMDPATSYWQPSGNQQTPAVADPRLVLGPAIVLRPRFGLPNLVDCTIEFGPEVVDKEGNRPCIPRLRDGFDPSDLVNAYEECEPGDTSAFTFHTTGMVLDETIPADGNLNAPRVGPNRNCGLPSAPPAGTECIGRYAFLIGFNSVMDVASLESDVIILENGVRRTFNVLENFATVERNNYEFALPYPEELPPATTYTITIPGTIRNTFGQPLGGPDVTVTFTTRS